MLREYYKNIVKINDSKTGGWGKSYYGVFSKVIEENNFKKVAEVGIGYGTHAKYILKNNPNIEKLYLIDPMIPYENDMFSDDIMSKIPEKPNNNFNEMCELIKEELKFAEDKYVWYRTKSLEVTNDEIEDGSLDAVFIDGAHDYDNVYKDLHFWFKKVRKGGQILGDDYWMNDVRNAVDHFSTIMEIPYDFLTLDNSNYVIYRFLR
jgi:predicted O-methyltransferase YrrM